MRSWSHARVGGPRERPPDAPSLPVDVHGAARVLAARYEELACIVTRYLWHVWRRRFRWSRQVAEEALLELLVSLTERGRATARRRT